MCCREIEEFKLSVCLSSTKSEFLAVYGRRRVGKTYLIRHYFTSKPVIFFNVTGQKDGPIELQLAHFSKALSHAFYQGAALNTPSSWDEAFDALTKAMQTIPKNKKIVLFFDELPWMATPRSGILNALDYYWNQHWSIDKRVKLIVCGSATSWILDNIISNQGGLHNRITQQILLEPFNLANTKQFLRKIGVKLNHRQLCHVYMLTGGVVYYLSFIKPGMSSTQIIEELAFSKSSPLLGEFDLLFSSLFQHAEDHVKLIRLIASKRYGIGQQTLLNLAGTSFAGKKGLTKLKELEEAGFISRFLPFGNKQKGVYYRVIDEYTLFYLKWIEPIKDSLSKRGTRPGYWAKQQSTPAWLSWSGLAFESVCYKHLFEISVALDLSALSLPYTWRHNPKKADADDYGAQIDLLFDRDDDSISLCEIKYSDSPYVINKAFVDTILRKKSVFEKHSKTKKQIFIALIAANGIKKNHYADELIDGLVTLDDLFKT
jgi:uncharacterized protein